jgi:hypothetical protein
MRLSSLLICRESWTILESHNSSPIFHGWLKSETQMRVDMAEILRLSLEQLISWISQRISWKKCALESNELKSQNLTFWSNSTAWCSKSNFRSLTFSWDLIRGVLEDLRKLSSKTESQTLAWHLHLQSSTQLGMQCTNSPSWLASSTSTLSSVVMKATVKSWGPPCLRRHDLQ